MLKKNILKNLHVKKKIFYFCTNLNLDKIK